MMDTNTYESLIQEIECSRLHVHGIEIFRNGETAFKKIFASDRRYPIYSATKSFTATAVGIAANEGKISINESLGDYLEKRYLEKMPVQIRNAFCRLSIKRFLTMSVSGYPFRPGGDDWLKSSLCCDIDYAAPPVFSYTNVSAYLVGIACENAVGGNLMDYLNSHLFEPLGIKQPEYQCDPQGHFYGATGMYLSVHELSLLGQLYLQKGMFRGECILSEDWVNDATSMQISHTDGGYGYFFWKRGEGFSISGKWGQKCLVFPAKNAMITYLGDMREEAGEMQRIVEQFAEHYL